MAACTLAAGVAEPPRVFCQNAAAAMSKPSAAMTHGSGAPRRCLGTGRMAAELVCGAAVGDPLQVQLRVVRRLQPVVGVLGQARADHPVQRPAATAAPVRPIGRGSSFMIDEISEAWLAARERPRAGRHLVQHAAQRPEVAARVRVLPFQLLRRHVLERADDRALRSSAPASASASSAVVPRCPPPGRSPAPGRSPSAWRRTSSASRWPASGRGAPAPCGAPCPARRRSARRRAAPPSAAAGRASAASASVSPSSSSITR